MKPTYYNVSKANLHLTNERTFHQHLWIVEHHAMTIGFHLWPRDATDRMLQYVAISGNERIDTYIYIYNTWEYVSLSVYNIYFPLLTQSLYIIEIRSLYLDNMDKAPLFKPAITCIHIQNTTAHGSQLAPRTPKLRRYWSPQKIYRELWDHHTMNPKLDVKPYKHLQSQLSKPVNEAS